MDVDVDDGDVERSCCESSLVGGIFETDAAALAGTGGCSGNVASGVDVGDSCCKRLF